MGRCWLGGAVSGQGGLLPVDVRDQLPADHRAWAVLEAVGDLDLSGFEAFYRVDGSGRPPYDPAAMVALIVYCGLKKQVTSQEIADACRDDLGARLIMGNTYPHRGTISRFFDHHGTALRGLLAQTVRLGDAEGLVDVSLVAGDGTKVAASAAMSATIDEEALRGQIVELEQQVQAAEADWAAVIAAPAGDGPDGPGLFPVGAASAAPATAGRDGPAGSGRGRDGRSRPAGGRESAVAAAWRRLGELTRRLERRRAALVWLLEHPPTTALAEWQERRDRDTARVAACQARVDALHAQVQARWEERQAGEAAGRQFRGKRPVPPSQHAHLRRERAALDTAKARAEATAAARPVATRVNTTDPSSRIMPRKQNAGYDQMHNVQALTCPGPFFLAIGTHDSPNDKQALQPLLQQGRANLDAAGIHRPIGAAVFDSGYASEENFAADLPVELLLVAVEQEARQTGRRADGVSTAAAAWQAMADILADPDNAALYKRRAPTIEPAFAQLFARFGRTLHARGDEAVLTELHVWAVTHNLAKIIRRRETKSRPAAAPP